MAVQIAEQRKCRFAHRDYVSARPARETVFIAPNIISASENRFKISVSALADWNAVQILLIHGI